MAIVTTGSLGRGQLRKTVRACDTCGQPAALLFGSEDLICESCAVTADAARAALLQAEENEAALKFKQTWSGAQLVWPPLRGSGRRDWSNWAATWDDIVAKVNRISDGRNLASVPFALMQEDGLWYLDVQVKTESAELDVTASAADLADAARGVYKRLGNYKVLWRRLD